MCFSAEASFTSAIVIAGIATLSLSKVKNRELIPFACIPLFFALQQSLEGFVWVTLNKGDTTSMLHNFSMYGFQFFAQIFWPLFVPGSLYLIEKDPKRKKLLTGSIFIGVILSFITLFSWSAYQLKASGLNHHVTYYFSEISFFPNNSELFQNILFLFYFVATAGSLFISSVRGMWIAGLIVSIGALITMTLYYFSFGSVWCFFCALSSMGVYFIVRDYKTNKEIRAAIKVLKN